MNTTNDLQDKILNVNSENFLDLALEVFDFQSQANSVYAEYLRLLNKHTARPITLEQIPFLPTELFRNRIIKSGDWNEELIFESSGTTQSIKSRHHVHSLNWYHQICRICFEHHYGSIEQYEFIGLLPSVEEKPNSSLISMVQFFVKASGSSVPAVSFINNHQELYKLMTRDTYKNKKIILIGLSFSLLDFAEQFVLDHPQLIVIETGGMKNSKRIMDKQRLIATLQQGFPNAAIHSEYGMTELMSQAYAADALHYSCAPVLKILISDPTDPTQFLSHGKRGIINIIDLGNLYTGSFIQTGDLGIINENGQLEVLGRYNPEEARGCVQMIEEM